MSKFIVFLLYLVSNHEGETAEFQCPKRLEIPERSNFTMEWYHNNQLINDSSLKERFSFDTLK